MVEHLPLVNGKPVEPVVAMCVHQDSLYVAIPSGIYKMVDGKFYPVMFVDTWPNEKLIPKENING